MLVLPAARIEIDLDVPGEFEILPGLVDPKTVNSRCRRVVGTECSVKLEHLRPGDEAFFIGVGKGIARDKSPNVKCRVDDREEACKINYYVGDVADARSMRGFLLRGKGIVLPQVHTGSELIYYSYDDATSRWNRVPDAGRPRL
jgi:hypothetical protein